MPSVDYMMKREEGAIEEGKSAKEMYIACSQKLNVLINTYFSAARGDNIEIKIAGNEEERADMMPLLYVDSDEVK